MKAPISYNEKSYTDDQGNEYFLGAFVPDSIADITLQSTAAHGTDDAGNVYYLGGIAPVNSAVDISQEITAAHGTDDAGNVYYLGGIAPVDSSVDIRREVTAAHGTDDAGNTYYLGGMVPTDSDLSVINNAVDISGTVMLANSVDDMSTPILISPSDDLPILISTNATKGNDTLTGSKGDDKLSGLAGDDLLIGGGGKDKLTGGTGADTFKFTSVSDSSFWKMDSITDFKHAQGDKIDLSAIDSNASLAGDQAFSLVSAFSSTDATGQLYFDAKTHILYASTDADSAPEFAITLNGVSSLVAADFIF